MDSSRIGRRQRKHITNSIAAVLPILLLAAVFTFFVPAVGTYADTQTFSNAATVESDLKSLFQTAYDSMSNEVSFVISGDEAAKKFLETDASGKYRMTKNADGTDTFISTALVQSLPEQQMMDMRSTNDNAYTRMALESYQLGYKVSYQIDSNGALSVQTITFTYTFSWHDGANALAAKNAVITHAKNYLNSSAYPSTSSEYIRLKAINAYICNTFQYDYRYFIASESSQTIYSAYRMINDSGAIGGYKRGVCQAYAMYGYIMLKQAGFEVITVDGNAGGGGHAWNMVKSRTQWYHIDFTWDDPISDGNPAPYTLIQSGAGFVEETYLLRTDAEISVNHSWLAIQNNYKYPLTPTSKYSDTAPMPTNVPTQYNPAPTVTLIPTKSPVATPTSGVSAGHSKVSSPGSNGTISSSKAETDDHVGSMTAKSETDHPSDKNETTWFLVIVMTAVLLAVLTLISTAKKK